MPTAPANLGPRKCQQYGCTEIITGRRIYCKKCVAHRKVIAKRIARGHEPPPQNCTDFEWLKRANSFLEQAKKTGDDYAQAQILENREKGLIKT
jgi:hypothetical protein